MEQRYRFLAIIADRYECFIVELGNCFVDELRI